jgi:hypothetical protein
MNDFEASSIMHVFPPVSPAYPAPLMLALRACHVLAPLILFNRNVAMRTFLRFDSNCPFF